MSSQRDTELMSAVSFICRNSGSSPARADLIRQVVRCHVAADYSHRLITQEVRQEIDSRVKAILRQMQIRGHI